MTRTVEALSSSKPSAWKKIDISFANDADINTLVSRFRTATWPYDRWTHRAHLAVGLCTARELRFDEALQRLREQINTYNAACGDPTGYNETVTILFLRKIVASFCEPNDARPLCEVVEELVRGCSLEWLYQYFSRDRIWSAVAKSAWIEPDVMPLDF